MRMGSLETFVLGVVKIVIGAFLLMPSGRKHAFGLDFSLAQLAGVVLIAVGVAFVGAYIWHRTRNDEGL